MVRSILIAVLALGGLLAACDRGTPTLPEQAQVTPPPRVTDPAQLALGRKVYMAHCKECHGEHAEGQPNWRMQGPDGRYPPPPLDGSGHAWHHTNAVLLDVIKHGSPGGLGNMPGWQDKLSDQEITAVIDWFKSLWPQQAYEVWYQIELESHRQ
ncbi:MAG: cytochrome c [Pseudomonadota bacterium]